MSKTPKMTEYKLTSYQLSQLARALEASGGPSKLSDMKARHDLFMKILEACKPLPPRPEDESKREEWLSLLKDFLMEENVVKLNRPESRLIKKAVKSYTKFDPKTKAEVDLLLKLKETLGV